MDIVNFEGEFLEDYDSPIDDLKYKKGQKVYVNNLANYKKKYAIYRYDSVDWIPKELIKIIK